MCTSRPLNKCEDCGYTWQPRGHDVSKRCPECKSEEVHSVGFVMSDAMYHAIMVGIVFIIGSMFFSNSQEPTPQPVIIQTQPAIVQPQQPQTIEVLNVTNYDGPCVTTNFEPC